MNKMFGIGTRMSTESTAALNALPVLMSAREVVRKAAFAMILVSLPNSLFAQTSVSQPAEAELAEPLWDDMPSYLNQPALTIAALVQDQVKSPSDSGATKPRLDESGQDNTLRNALETLSDTEDPLLTNNDGQQGSDVPARSLFADRRTEMVDGRFALPPIEALTTNTTEIGNGHVPLGFRQGENSPLIKLPESGTDRGLPWQWNARLWAASNTFSHPLYFEDRMLERHGHERFPHLQPLISGGRFFAQTFSLSYLSAINPPCECQYSLGYYRAGSCVPALKQRPPYMRKAAAAQLTAVAIGATIYP